MTRSLIPVLPPLPPPTPPRTPTTGDSARPPDHPFIHIRSIIAWAVIQLLALALGVFDVPLWAHHPLPRESLAAQEMVAVQMAASAMLFPILFGNFSTAVTAAAMVWPFIQLAGMLSLSPPIALLRVSFFISLWIIGLWACATMLRSAARMMVGICLAEIFTLGSVLLWFVKMDSHSSPAPSPAFGPLAGALRQVNGNAYGWPDWFCAGAPLMVGAAWHITHRLRTRRHRP